MSFISRAFQGRPREQGQAGRLPPGQYLVRDFPVLSAGPTPRTALTDWTFSITGEIDKLKNWTWDEFRKLPRETVTRDIHCVTKWSKLDTVWEGISVDTLLDGVETSAEYVMAISDGGYTTNYRLRTLPAARHGSPSTSMVRHSRQSTVAQRGSWCRISTSGRARSGCVACS